MALGNGDAPAPLRDGVVHPVRVDAGGVGGPTRMQARGRAWRRTSRGLYVPSSVDGALPEQRIIEAAAVLPDFGGVTGWASLRWAGGVWFDGLARDGRARLPVTLVTGYSDVRNQPAHGIVISQERLGQRDVYVIAGLRSTSLVRSLCFEMRYAADEREAAVVLDMAAYSDLVSIQEIALYAFAHSGWTGIPQCRDALVLADEDSWSPWETRMRLVWMLDAGFPRPLCNPPIFDRSGQLIGTPDILDPEAGVAGEYDGAVHLDGDRRRHDRSREADFRRVGLEYFTVMSGDSRAETVARMSEARQRARWQPESRRAWTLDLPSWWTPTSTVDLRRALDRAQRERLLRLRRRVA